MIGDRPSPAMQAILDRIAREDAGLPDSTTLAPALGRAQTARSHVRWRSDLPAIQAVRDVQAAGGDGQMMRCRLYLPVAAPDRTLLFLHGGGWAFCDIDTHDDLCRRLALDSGAAVLACDYRLAPEHPYPAALADCSALLRAALAGGFADLGAGGRVSIAGDSAGANLALAVMLHEAAAGRRLPTSAALFYPVTQGNFDTDSYLAFAGGPGLTRAKMQRFWDWYAPGDQRDAATLCPLLADDAALRALPPVFLVAAGVDPLRSDSELLWARLQGLNRKNDRFHLAKGLAHGFMQMAAVLPDAGALIAESAAFVRTFG